MGCLICMPKVMKWEFASYAEKFYYVDEAILMAVTQLQNEPTQGNTVLIKVQ